MTRARRKTGELRETLREPCSFCYIDLTAALQSAHTTAMPLDVGVRLGPYEMSIDGVLMAVDIRTEGTTLRAGTPHALFQTNILMSPLLDQYAVSADGDRFLVNVPFDAPEQLSI